jgi:hypothetical protein
MSPRGTAAKLESTARRSSAADRPPFPARDRLLGRTHAKALAYLLHFVAGQIFALIYYAIFASINESSWLLGALFGFVHGVVVGTALVNVLLPAVHPRMGTPSTAADSSALLEPPGFLMLNYGRSTPLVAIVVHMIYGSIVGGFVSLSG